jgi:cyclopropane fatty-acyl-phospholipid synthase-like methyltransferase
MLRLADVQPGQRVVDLGAGDGRIVIAAALLFKAHAVGVEIDPIRCLLANTLIFLLGLRDRAHVYYGNMFEFDLVGADVVTLYLWPSTNQRFRQRLTEQLRPGAKVVSFKFTFYGWTPISPDGSKDIYLYEIGNTEPDMWAALGVTPPDRLS